MLFYSLRDFTSIIAETVVCSEIPFSKNLYQTESSLLISNANQLPVFYMINFYWKLFSNRLYLFGASFSSTHQKFINLVPRVSSVFDVGQL